MTARDLGALALSVVTLTTDLSAAQSGAKSLYRDPAVTQFVGLHYWLETSTGARLTEKQAASAAGRFTLHIRCNTPAFLTVWSTEDGSQLTPIEPPFGGYVCRPGREFVAPGDFRLAPADSKSRLLVLLARSQTEQVSSVARARIKLDSLAAAMGRDGTPAIVRQSDDVTAGEVGTYVVHREGGQPAAEIPVVR